MNRAIDIIIIGIRTGSAPKISSASLQEACDRICGAPTGVVHPVLMAIRRDARFVLTGEQEEAQ